MFCSNCGQQNDQSAKFCFKCGNQLSVESIIASPSAHSQTQSAEPVAIYAGFWKRLAALILDMIILWPLQLILIIWIADGFGLNKNLATFLVGIPSTWIYFADMESSARQATFGKRALGIKVVDLRGNRISFGRASGRHFGKLVSGLTMFGCLMVAFTKHKQTLHDKMADCLVVNKTVSSVDIQNELKGSASN